jgi:hypothetical protein
MLKTIEGIVREGKLELLEPVPQGASGRVIVTFLENGNLESRNVRLLSDYGIDREQAANLRHRLAAFVEDWERPEMDVYDVD